MKLSRPALLGAGLLVAGLLAFFLRDVIRQAVVIPLAYVWWVLQLAYSIVPQLFLWILLLACLVVILLSSLLKRPSAGRPLELPTKPAQGAVETLAAWISNAGGRGNYYRWLIANRLGKLAAELADRFGDRRGLAGRLHSAPDPVQRYLRAGLEESFVDYPQPALPFMRRPPTPFDLDVDQAVEYLESLQEDHGGK